MGRVLTRCSYAVVARTAGPCYLRVIDGNHWRPEIRRVAVLADIGRLNV